MKEETKTSQQVLQEAREEFEKDVEQLSIREGNDPRMMDAFAYKIYELSKSFLTSTLQSFIEAEIAFIEKRVKYIDDFRSGKNEQDFRNGWSGSESGECCDKCRMEDRHFNGRADALKAIIGCRNPFQLKDVCECHIPFRKVAAKVERIALQDQILHLKGIISNIKEITL